VSKLKSILMNPFLIGVQGFAVGALLLWAGGLPAIA
jgi:hypothetical protein